jgi:hypothetical protein
VNEPLAPGDRDGRALGDGDGDGLGEGVGQGCEPSTFHE